MDDTEELFHEIATSIPDAKEGKMFGAVCIKSANGKVAAIFWKNDMLFKLGKDDLIEALALEGARVGSHLYNPDRPMKGWALIPARHSSKWAGLSARAISYVKTL